MACQRILPILCRCEVTQEPQRQRTCETAALTPRFSGVIQELGGVQTVSTVY